MIMISGQETVSEFEPGMVNDRMTDCSAPVCSFFPRKGMFDIVHC